MGTVFKKGNVNNISLLLHMDESFADSSFNNFTVTPYGDAQISTTEKMFGTGSAYFDGDEDYLEITDITEFEFGSENFTLECWIRVPEGGGGTVIARWGGDDENPFFFYANIDQGIVVYLNNTFIMSGGTIIPDAWQHIALVRNGSVIKAFIDGIDIQAEAELTDPLHSSTVALRIGGDVYGNTKFNGYIDELRITKGVARYTANFTPPVAPFSMGDRNKINFLKAGNNKIKFNNIVT